MGARRLLILVVAYVVFDLGDPALPGAFSFEVKDSEIEEALHVHRPRTNKAVIAVRPAPPERRAEPRDDSLTCPRLAAIEPPVRDTSPPRSAPRSALRAPAPSPDDH